jgi:hypothetical protein
MRCVAALAFLGSVTIAASADPVKTPPAKAKTTASAHKGSVRRVPGRRLVHGRWVKVSSRRAAPAPSYQLHPEPARYQEIQKALADKGYFKGEPNGQWSGDSVDALKRFQTDRNLPSPDGKINALTLSGLGLGPKHEGGSGPPPAEPPK